MVGIPELLFMEQISNQIKGAKISNEKKHTLTSLLHKIRRQGNEIKIVTHNGTKFLFYAGKYVGICRR